MVERIEQAKITQVLRGVVRRLRRVSRKRQARWSKNAYKQAADKVQHIIKAA